MKKIILCVPNFSEGRNLQVIKQITDEIESVDGVKLLSVEPGASTNRTVVAFAGTPDEVCESAFRTVKKASELIDMRKHKGAHPRIGATDVCPLVPVDNISMEEVVNYAHNLAERIGNELKISVFCYENAAFSPERKNLENIRAGEYEGLAEKITLPKWKPDYGSLSFNAKSGAIVVGAREPLVAINFNLNTTSTRRANAIAFDVRERGRYLRQGHPLTGKIKKDEHGNDIMIPGSLKATKAIGWYIEEYGFAQVSMNITNISITPVHIAFDEVCAKAANRGIRVTGSEIVGLIPKSVLIDAGKYYLTKQKRSLGVSEDELIKIAVKSLGLNDITPFDPKEKVIEFILEDKNKNLVNLSCKDFCNEISSEAPAPGGGSVSACIGAFGSALAAMVANISSHKRGWDEEWEYFSVWAEKAQAIKEKLMFFIDEDTKAFNNIISSYSLPKRTNKETEERNKAIQEATLYATQVPLNVMKTAFEVYEICMAMAESGLKSSVSDVGVGVLAVSACIKGAMLNVKINSVQLEDKKTAEKILKEGEEIVEKSEQLQNEILNIVNSKIK